MSTGVPKLPEILEKIADVVLAHRPKPKLAKGDTTKGTKTKKLRKKREDHKNNGTPKNHR